MHFEFDQVRAWLPLQQRLQRPHRLRGGEVLGPMHRVLGVRHQRRLPGEKTTSQQSNTFLFFFKKKRSGCEPRRHLPLPRGPQGTQLALRCLRAGGDEPSKVSRGKKYFFLKNAATILSFFFRIACLRDSDCRSGQECRDWQCRGAATDGEGEEDQRQSASR